MIKSSLLLHTGHIVMYQVFWMLMQLWQSQVLLFHAKINMIPHYYRSQTSFSSWHCLYHLLSYFQLLPPYISQDSWKLFCWSLFTSGEMIQNVVLWCLHLAYWGICQHQLKAEGRSTLSRAGASSLDGGALPYIFTPLLHETEASHP